MADVSPGTVDRVIHKRGKVSSDKLQRIQAVLKEINYQPNIIAKTLKNNRIYQIAVLIPETSSDEYWQKVEFGVREALNEFSNFGIRANIQYYHINNKDSFQSEAMKVIKSNPDGILVAPMSTATSKRFFDECRVRKLPYIVFNSPLKEVNPLALIGQDLHQSGRLAAELIYLSQSTQGEIVLMHIDETPQNAPHVHDKEKGIKTYFRDKSYDMTKIKSIELFRTDMEDLDPILEKELSDLEKLSGVIVTTSKVFEIAEYVNHKYPEATIVGYDLVSANTKLLSEGKVTFLINQSPIQQAYLGIQRFVDHFIFEKTIPSSDLLPIQVVTRENLHSIQIQKFGTVRV